LDFESTITSLGSIGQITFLDLLLSGDNALVIALACRGLPAHMVRRAIGWGTLLAVALRVVLTGIIGFLMNVPYLKLIGAVLLIGIAIKLQLDEEEAPGATETGQRDVGSSLMSAIVIIVSADLALSLDNVVALAAAAKGSWLLLGFGLVLSMPLLMYGSLFVSRLLAAYPLLIPAGSALLGIIAGQIAVTDPVWGPWVATQAPGLSVAAPVLCALFVLFEARIVREQRAKLAAPPPLGIFERIGNRLAGRMAAPVATTPDTTSAALDVAITPPAVEAVEVVEHAPAHAEQIAPEAPRPPTPVAPPPAPPKRARKPEADPVQQSRKLSIAINIAKLVVAVVGAIAFGWILLHLFTQGFLPAPPVHH